MNNDYQGCPKVYRAALVLSAALLFLAVLLLLFGGGKNGWHIAFAGNETAVIAHRAGAPENTLEALYASIEAGADMAELDIRETKDHVLVALHDVTLKRVAGLGQNIWDLDFEELKEIDVGNGQSVPSLEELLRASRGKIRLMLELKTVGITESVMELLNEYNMADQCCIASMILSVLRETKELDPDMETVYISKKLKKSDLAYTYVDSYSIKVSGLMTSAVSSAHRAGKKVYGWTAVRRSQARKVLWSGADGVITDDVGMARRAAYGG